MAKFVYVAHWVKNHIARDYNSLAGLASVYDTLISVLESKRYSIRPETKQSWLQSQKTPREIVDEGESRVSSFPASEIYGAYDSNIDTINRRRAERAISELIVHEDRPSDRKTILGYNKTIIPIRTLRSKRQWDPRPYNNTYDELTSSYMDGSNKLGVFFACIIHIGDGSKESDEEAKRVALLHPYDEPRNEMFAMWKIPLRPEPDELRPLPNTAVSRPETEMCTPPLLGGPQVIIFGGGSPPVTMFMGLYDKDGPPVPLHDACYNNNDKRQGLINIMTLTENRPSITEWEARYQTRVNGEPRPKWSLMYDPAHWKPYVNPFVHHKANDMLRAGNVQGLEAMLSQEGLSESDIELVNERLRETREENERRQQKRKRDYTQAINPFV
jgi:hypothetical protein